MKSLKPIITLALTLGMSITSLSTQAQNLSQNQSQNLSQNPKGQKLDRYKLAVIKDTLASSSISSGQYLKGITMLTNRAIQSPDDLYEDSMSLCTANIKLNHYNAAMSACDNAISAIEQTQNRQKTKNKYKALALNNRAIVKYLSNDSRGAYQDFNQALDLNNSKLISANFDLFTSKVVGEQFAAVGY